MIKGLRLLFLLLVLAGWGHVSMAQTVPGLIYKPATGDGASVLDPNGDGFTSSTTAGFTYSDVDQSEISFSPLPQLEIEPIGDVRTGSSGGHTDMADNGSRQTGFMYYDAENQAMLFRIRLAGQSTASKGYSIFFNTDFEVFGPKGGNFSSTNPGFQFEIVLETGKGVKVYEWDGDSVTGSTTLSLDDHFQKSISYDHVNGSTGYFYDWYVPLSALSGFDALTPFRASMATITRAGSGISGTISDILGIDDQNYDNPKQAVIEVIESFPPTTPTDISDGGGFGDVVLPASNKPTISRPVTPGSTEVSGFVSEPDGSTVELYVDGVLEGSTTVTGGAWTISTSALEDGDVLKARAIASEKDWSPYSDEVTVKNSGTGPGEALTVCLDAATSAFSVSAFDANNPTISGTTANISDSDIGIMILRAGTDTAATLRLSNGNPTSTLIVPHSSLTINGDTWSFSTGAFSGNINSQVSSDYSYEAVAYRISDGTETPCFGARFGPVSASTATLPSAPTIDETSYAEGTAVSISGAFEGSADGTGWSVQIYRNGVRSTETMTVAGTTWSGTIDLVDGDEIYAVSVDGNLASAPSDTSTVYAVEVVDPDPSAPPVITGEYTTSSTSIAGYTLEGLGTDIIVYVNETDSLGTVEADLNGDWELTGVDLSAYSPGDEITATATAPGKGKSEHSDPVQIQASALAQPSITGPSPLTINSNELSVNAVAGYLALYVDNAPIAYLSHTGGSATYNSADFYYDLSVNGTDTDYLLENQVSDANFLRDEFYKDADVQVSVRGFTALESPLSSAVTVLGIEKFNVIVSDSNGAAFDFNADGPLYAGQEFYLQIEARDNAGDIFTEFTNTARLYSAQVPISDGYRVTDAFVSGENTHTTKVDNGSSAAVIYAIDSSDPTISGATDEFEILNPEEVTLTSLDPEFRYVGEREFELTLTGSNFVSSSVVRLNGADRTTSFASSTELVATIPASDLTSEATHQISVYSPPPQGTGEETSSLSFEVRAPPAPTISSITDNSAYQYGSKTVTITGTNLIAGVTEVRFPGSSITFDAADIEQGSDYTTITVPISIGSTTAGLYDVQVENPGHAAVSLTDGFEVLSSAHSAFTVQLTETTDKTAGEGFEITVTAVDDQGDTVTSFDGTVDFSLSSGEVDPELSGTFTSGVWTGNVSASKSGSGITLTVVNRQEGADQSGESDPFNVVAGSPDSYDVTVSESSPVAGSDVTATAQLKDAYGNDVLTSGRTVNWSVTNIGDGSFSASSSSTNGSGVATVTFTTDSSSGTEHRITATDTQFVTGQSPLFTTIAGLPEAVAFVTTERTTTAGTATQVITLQLQDDLGNSVQAPLQMTFDLSVNSSTGVFRTSNNSGDLPNSQITFNAGVSEVSFLYRDTQTGSYTITAELTTDGTVTDTQGVTVNPGSLDSFRVRNSSGSSLGDQTAGTPFDLQLTAVDAYGNTKTSFSGTVNVSLNKGSLTTGSGTTASFTSGVLSSHSVEIQSTDTDYRMKVSNTDGGSPTGQSNLFDVSDAGVDHFVIVSPGESLDGSNQVTGTATDWTSGGEQTIRIVALDEFDNIATGVDGTQTITFSGPSDAPDGTSPVATDNGNSDVEFGTGTSIAFTGGDATGVPVTLFRAESTSISVSNGTQTGSSSSLDVVADADWALSMVTQPSETTAGESVAGPPTVELLDSVGNPIEGEAVTVSEQGSYSFDSGTTTQTTDAGGRVSFSDLVIETTGSYTLVFANGTAASDQASNVFDVTWAAFAGFEWDLNSPQQSGEVFTGTNTLTAVDAYGNGVEDFAASSGNPVTLSVTTLTGDLSGLFGNDGNELNDAAHFTNGVADLTDLGLIYTGASGTGNLVASHDPGTGEITASEPLTIQGGPADALTLSADPSSQTAGNLVEMTLTIVDGSGNGTTVSGATELSLAMEGSPTFYSDAGGTSAITTLSLSDGDGSATFWVTNTVAGAAQTLTVAVTSQTDAGLSGEQATEDLEITPAALDRFLVEANGGGTLSDQTAGTPFDLQLTAVDEYENTVTTFTGTADLSLNQESFVSGGGTTAAFTAGELTAHSVQIDRARTNYEITAKNSADETITGTSNTFDVLPNGNLQLVTLLPGETFTAGSGVSGSPSDQTVATDFDVEVHLTDNLNNPVQNAGATSDLTLSVQTGTGSLAGGASSGTLAVGSSSTTITGVQYDEVESGVVLQLDATNGSPNGLSDTSTAFDILAGAPDGLALTGAGSVTAGKLVELTLEVRDISNVAAPVTGDTDFSLAMEGSPSFYSDSEGNTEIDPATITLANGSSQTTFWVSNTATGSAQTVTVTRTSGPDAGLDGESATHDLEVTAGSASTIVFTTPVRTIASGGESSNLELELRDDWGNQALGSGTTTLELSASPANLTFLDTVGDELSPASQLTIGDQASTAAFRVTGTTAADYTITVEDAADGLTSASQSFEVTVTGPDAGNSLVEASPATQTVGDDVTVKVTVRDTGGNLLESEDVAIYTGGSLVGTGTSNASGEVSQTYSQQTPGTVEFVAYLGSDDQGTEITDRASVEFETGAFAGFEWNLNSTQQSGEAFSGTNTLTAVDAYGNGVEDFAASSGNPVILSVTTLTGDLSGLFGNDGNELNDAAHFTNGVADLTDLGLIYTGASGTGNLVASHDPGTGEITASEPLTIQEGPADALTLSADPSSQTAGNFVEMTLTIVDGSGNGSTVSGATELSLAMEGSPTFYSDAGGTSEITTLSLSDGDGSATFWVRNTEAGAAQTLTMAVTSQTDAGLSGEQATEDLEITPAGVDHFVMVLPGESLDGSNQVTGTATDWTSGGEQTIRIVALDEFDNIATGVDGSQTLTFTGPSDAPDGTSPVATDNGDSDVEFGIDTSIAFTDGDATGVPATLFRAETTSISVSNGTQTGSSNNFDVTWASLAGFEWELNSSQKSGEAFIGTNTLTAVDAYGNGVEDFAATSGKPVALSVTTLTGDLSGLFGDDGNELNDAAHFTNGVADLTDLGLTYTGASGTGNLVASHDPGTGEITTSESLTIGAGKVDAGNSLVEASPATQTVGNDVTVTVTVRDTGNNLLEGEDIAVYIVDGDQLGTGTSDASGEVSLMHSQDTPGEVEFVAYLGSDDQGTEVTSRATAEFESGAVNRFVLVTTDGDPIGDQVAGETFEVQVQAVDSLGNVVPGYEGEKTVQFSGGGTAPDGDSNPDYPEKITFTDGVASPIEITLYMAETDVELTLTAETISGTSDPFDVSSNKIFTIRLEGPESLVAGEVSEVLDLTILDAYENTAPVSEDTEFDLSSSGAVFYLDAAGENKITTYTVTDGGGTGAFYYSSNESGVHTITATWSSGESLLDGQSASSEIQVGAAAPDRLEIVTQPEVDVEGEPLTVQPVLHLLDEHGNRVNTDSSTEVLVDIGEGNDGELGGSTKVTFKEGVGTFGDLILSGTPLTDYKLRFRTEPDHGLDPVLSDSLSMASVAAGLPASLVKVSGDDQSRPTRSELEELITVRVLDRDEEPLAGQKVQFSFKDVPTGAVDHEAVDSLLVSDEEGLVRARIRLGSEPGNYIVEASAREGIADPVSFGATATFTAPNPTFVDTVNTVVFSGGLSSYMYSEFDESIDQPDGMNFETWVLPNSLESDDGVIAARWEEENPQDQQFRVRVLDNVVTLDVVDELGNRYSLEIPDFFRTGAGSSLLSLNSTMEEGMQLQDNHEEFSWTHISVVVDPTNELIQIYRDGFEVKRTQLFARMRSTQSRLEVGRGFDGEVHEIRQWSRPRSRTEIQAQKDLTLTGTEENLELYHTFDDTSNTEIAEDTTPNQNHFYFGEDVDRKFSLRNVTVVTMHQREDFIVRLAALDKTGGAIRASVIELPKNGKLFQLGEELKLGDPIETTGEELTEAFNRSLYKPDVTFAGLDSIRYRITDQYGNYSDSVMKFEVLAVNRPPIVDMIGQADPGDFAGRLEFDQRDSLKIGLDTLVTHKYYRAEEMDWTIDIVDKRRRKICLSLDAGSDLQSCVDVREEEESLVELSGAAARLQQEEVTGSVAPLQEDPSGMELVKSVSEGNLYKAWILQETGEYLIVHFRSDLRELTLTSTDRFHDQDLHLRVKATDPEGLSGRRDFYVTVHQVNDPPSDFSLLQPADQDTIPINQLQFVWESSADTEGDPIEYTLFLERDDGRQLQVEALTDTLFAFEEYPELLQPDREFTWWVEASDPIEQTESRERWSFLAGDEVPLIYKLRQNYPNPWRSETTIEYWIPIASRVVIEIYDVLGRRIETIVDEERVDPGIYRPSYSNGRLASGIYFYRMVAQGSNGSRYIKTLKMTYIR